MNNFSRFGLGTDITTPVGYLMATTDRLGPITLEFENLGSGLDNSYIADANSIASQNATNTATIAVKQFIPTIDPVTGLGLADANGVAQGTWSTLISNFTVAPLGRVEKPTIVFAKYIAIFGSGLTTVSLNINHTHAAALRGGHIDIVPVGRQGYGFDPGTNANLLFPPPLT